MPVPRNSYSIRLSDAQCERIARALALLDETDPPPATDDDLFYLRGCFTDQLDPNERDVLYGFCL